MVAASSAIGSLFAIGGYNKEVVMVADEGHVVFYSSKTMRKIRSQRVSDARIVGINAVTGVDAKEGPQYLLHVVDTLGNYFIVDIATNYVVESHKMTITTAAADKDGAAKPVIGGRRPTNATSADSVINAQWTSVANEAADGVAKDDSTIPSSLRVVLLTPNGVYAQHVSNIVSARSTVPFTKALNFPGPLTELVMAVGKENGIVLVGQRHRTWMWVSSAAEGIASPKGAPLRHLSLPARLMSAAVTPLAASTAFSVGGDRGEIAYYPTANIDTGASLTLAANNSNIATADLSAPLRFFSDHWHSTPLQAVAFSEDGKSVLSGAAERALVSWSVSGAFTRTKIMSSRREELTEGYLWKAHTEAKLDKKSRFRPKVKKNGEAEGQTFITTDVASIIIPHVHGAVPAAASPFNSNAAGCYVVGVSGQVAAMDLREQKVAASADGVRWSMSAEAAVGPSAVPQRAEAIEWMGRPALLLVSPADSEIRVIDPITQQSLYTHHVRFNMETSLVNPSPTSTAAPGSKEGAGAEEADPLGAYFQQNKDALSKSSARGTIGGLLAAVADGGRTVFTCEDLSHIGLDSVLRVWRYDAEKQRHVEVQSIHNPHATEMLQMRAVTVRVPRSGKKADEDAYDLVSMLFTMDRLGVKCWRSVELPKHEARGAAATQRNFLHLGGVGGANGEKEADAFLWRVVGTNRCASGRASCFEVSEDGTVILVADEVVRAFEVPLVDLSLAFSPSRQGRGFAVADWEPLFTLQSPAAAGGVAVDGVRFIVEGGALPAVFARFADGFACCWQADEAATWATAWTSSGIHSLLSASSGEGSADALVLAVANSAAGHGSSSSAMSLSEVTIAPKKAPAVKVVSSLPSPNGTVQYVVMGSAAAVAGSSSSAADARSILADVRVLSVDGSGVRNVPIVPIVSAVETFGSSEEAKAKGTADKRLDLFFNTVAAAIAADGDDDNANGVSTTAPSSQQLLSKVLGSEAYAAPPMSLVLTSLLSIADGQQ